MQHSTLKVSCCIRVLKSTTINKNYMYVVVAFVLCLVTQSFPTLCNPMDCSLPGFSWQEYWSGFPPAPPGNLLHPGTEPMYPTLQVNSLPSEPPGKPMNTGVDRLSLLQDIFSTQEWNWGRLHCRWVLYQLSHTVINKQINNFF